MAADLRFRLSRLQPLAQYLAQGVDLDAGLLEALEEALPGKQTEQNLRVLDKLLEQPGGIDVVVGTVGFLLDEWLAAGDEQLRRTSQALEPHEWLATSDHLEVVQQFRQLL